MEIQPFILDATALKIGTSSGERAEGLHASDVYNDLYQDLEPDRYRRGTSPNPLLLEIGLAFENFLEEWLARRIELASSGQAIRPGEFTYEDTFEGRKVVVHYNPDLLIFNGVTRVGEIKATKMSSGIPAAWLTPEHFPAHADDIRQVILEPKFDKYLTQVKFYLYMLRMRYARFYIFFINGKYRPDIDPQLIGWDVEFSQDELDMNYSMLMYHAISKGLL